ncbi:Transmembrane alpha-helix domain [Ceratobasidium sp. AG-Ba]|nr:Transmembrane alpha-helix domain [Ceratobasidium sp. AG-Ba]QRW15321.1 Transmembrane alpha-helix domain [Ceratobasidium sp. AG-Ba]
MAPRAARLTKRAGPACVPNAETWWNNDQGLNPCDVYQSILDKCGFTAPAITGIDSYYPVLSAQECMCNTITYNLGSACQDCQRGATDQGINVSLYTSGGDGCPSFGNNLPDTVVPTDDIPFWALQDTSTQFWSYDVAKQIALSATATATSSQSTPTETGSTTEANSMSATQTLTPTETPTVAPVTSGHKSTNAGAIGGGVGGGVVALLVIIGLLLFWRRRRARQSHGGAAMGGLTEAGGRNPSASSESSLTESGKGVGMASHYTPHSQMAQLHQNGSGVLVGSYSSASALTTPVDAPPIPSIPREYATPTPARSLAASPTPSQPAPAATNKVKRVPVRYSEDELAQAEQAEIEARKASLS